MYTNSGIGAIESAALVGMAVPVQPDTLTIREQGTEVIRIAPEGRVFWKGREVETDEDFRSAMMELAQQLVKNMR